ncbi:MAG: 3'-5' exonuclease, partial [Acidimicrobiia bacterium]
PSDEVSWKRIVNVPRRGVGDTSIGKIERYARGAGIDFAEALAEAPVAGVTGTAVKGIRELLELTDDIRSSGAKGVADMLEAILKRSGYLAELEAEHSIESQGRLENLQELVGVAREFDERVESGTGGALSDIAGITTELDGNASTEPPKGVARLQAFLEGISLVTDMDTTDGEMSAVTLMTLHTAKGLEFPVVFLTGLEDGIFPHVRSLGNPDELEEERRLCYVGLTRARERLFLTHAWTRTLFGATDYFPPSRFLDEIPKELVEVIGTTRRSVRSSRDDRAWGRPQSTVHATHEALGKDRVAAAALLDTNQPKEPAGARGAERAGLHVGDDVMHEKFGEGVIIDVRGEGERAEARVRFRGVGEKTLLLAWAPLTRLG